MTTSVRPATPEDAPFLAWVMQAAARSHLPVGIWDLMLPGPDAPRLEALETYAKTSLVHFAHWTRFKVAEIDGEVAAALSAYDPAEHGHDRISVGMTQAFTQLGWSPDQMATAVGRLAPFGSLQYPNPDGFWVIEWVATLPDFRGRGAVHTLLLEILEQGRELGYREAQIGYLLGNEPAKRAYEKVGFKFVDEFRSEEFEAALDCAGMARMHLDL